MEASNPRDSRFCSQGPETARALKVRLARLGLVLLLAALAGALGWRMIEWKSPQPPQNAQWILPENDPQKLHFKLAGPQGNFFEVDLVEHSASNSLNPYFPSIRIQTPREHNAWVHIVYTDSKFPQWTCFIDAQGKDRPNSLYPFYTYGQDFYDAPLWSYSLFHKPLTFWKGHAFAVYVDPSSKTLRCKGGIEWGFKLSLFNVRPSALAPRLLEESDWQQAWALLEKQLPGYHQSYE